MKRTGFTLIELLVVIGIIGLLVAIALPNYLSARQRASDSRLKSDMSELKNALRLYYNDYKTYPKSFNGTYTRDGLMRYGSIAGCGTDGLQYCDASEANCGNAGDFAAGALCDNVYMKIFPSALGRSGVSPQLRYTQQANGEDFCLRTVLSNMSDPDVATSQTRCNTSCAGSCVGNGVYCACAD